MLAATYEKALQRATTGQSKRFLQAGTAARATMSLIYRAFGGGWGIEVFQQSVQN
jgi:hypothetical protein